MGDKVDFTEDFGITEPSIKNLLLDIVPTAAGAASCPFLPLPMSSHRFTSHLQNSPSFVLCLSTRPSKINPGPPNSSPFVTQNREESPYLKI